MCVNAMLAHLDTVDGCMFEFKKVVCVFMCVREGHVFKRREDVFSLLTPDTRGPRASYHVPMPSATTTRLFLVDFFGDTAKVNLD